MIIFLITIINYCHYIGDHLSVWSHPQKMFRKIRLNIYHGIWTNMNNSFVNNILNNFFLLLSYVITVIFAAIFL